MSHLEQVSDQLNSNFFYCPSFYKLLTRLFYDAFRIRDRYNISIDLPVLSHLEKMCHPMPVLAFMFYDAFRKYERYKIIFSVEKVSNRMPHLLSRFLLFIQKYLHDGMISVTCRIALSLYLLT